MIYHKRLYNPSDFLLSFLLHLSYRWSGGCYTASWRNRGTGRT